MNFNSLFYQSGVGCVAESFVKHKVESACCWIVNRDHSKNLFVLVALLLLQFPVMGLAKESPSFLFNDGVEIYGQKSIGYGDEKTLLTMNNDAYSFNNVRQENATETKQDQKDLITLSEYNPDYESLKRDTYYFFGFQFFILGALYISPESVSGWSEEQKQNFTREKYKHNVQDIIWDNDKFYINYILHPYWGMAYYIRARENGFNHTDSFWYAAALSTMWEFGLEAMFEEVSIQDVFITPIVGAVIGKYVDVYRSNIKKKPVLTNTDKWMLGITDPLGATNRWVDGLFGKNASVSFNYSLISSASKSSFDNGYSYIDREISVQRPATPSLGLTFKYEI